MYRDPGLTIGGGISVVYWSTQQVGVSLRFDYNWMRAKYLINGTHDPRLEAVWRLVFAPITLGCEYRLPFEVDRFCPFIGVGAGLALCSIEYEQNYFELDYGPPAFAAEGTTKNPLTFLGRVGFNIHISESLSGQLEAEYWRSGNIHQMRVRTPSGQSEVISLQLSGIAFAFSVQF
jgi:hypothetical protein